MTALRCPCGRWGSFALVVLSRGITTERRVCYAPQCARRREIEQELAAYARRTGARAEVRPVDVRSFHRTESPRPSMAA